MAVGAGAGRDFSVVCDAAGGCFSFGHPEHGKLGNGSESKSLERAGKFTFDCVGRPTQVGALAGTTVTGVACGNAHTVAMARQTSPFAEIHT